MVKLNDLKMSDTEFTAILLDCMVLFDPDSGLPLEAFLHEMEASALEDSAMLSI